MPKKLFDIFHTLIVNNEIYINVGNKSSRNIRINKGVGQGLPSSPTLFNLAIDFILKSISEKEVTDEFGYKISEDLPSIIGMAFADDIAIITKNMNAASKIIEMVSNDFDRIGLEINMNKSMAIVIEDGKQIYLENGWR